MIWIVLHISKSALSIPGGILSDRVGRRQVILGGWLVYGLVYVAFAFSQLEWHAWALFASYGVYSALTEGVERAFVADVVPEEERGSAFGLYNFVVGIAALPASIIFGGVWQAFGYRAAFLLGAALALVASFVLIGFARRPISQ